MRKKVLMFSFFAFVQLFLPLNVSSESSVKIGVNLPLTGIYGALGESSRTSLNIAAEEINSAGGMLGRKIEYVFLDNKGDPDLARGAYSNLLRDRQVALTIGGIGISDILSIEPIALREKSIYVTPTPVSKYFKAIVNPWLFYAADDPTARADVLAKKLLETVKGKITIIAPKGPLEEEVARHLEKKFAAEHKTSNIILFEIGTKDFSPYFSDLLKRKPEGLVFISFRRESQIGSLIKKSREVIKWPIIEGILAPESQVPFFAEFNGCLIPTFSPVNPPDQIQKFKTFSQKFREKEGQYPGYYPQYFYILIHLLADSVNKAGSLDAVKIRDALETYRRIEGPTGLVTIDSKTHRIFPKLYLGQVKEGQIVYVTGPHGWGEGY